MEDWPTPKTKRPDMEDLKEMVLEGMAEATDGCDVETDGICPHGHPSWLLRLELV